MLNASFGSVLIALERRGAEVGYLRTAAGQEVDFHARLPDGSTWLLLVCAGLAAPDTFEREVRALTEARVAYPDATPLLLSLDVLPPGGGLPSGLRWQSALEWLLGGPVHLPARGRRVRLA